MTKTIVSLLVGLLLAITAHAQSLTPPPLAPVHGLSVECVGEGEIYSTAEVAASNVRRDASCRIFGQLGLGSGTLVAKRKEGDKIVGVVLTCAHIYQPGDVEALRKVPVRGAWRNDDNNVRDGALLSIDFNNDLAAIAFYVHPDTPVIPISNDVVRGGNNQRLYVCGYGPDGHYQCHIGPVIGYTSASWTGSRTKNTPAISGDRFVSNGKNQIYVASGGLRKGDSGGGMINEDGELAGVFWGGNGDRTYGTASAQLHRFVASVPQTFQWAVDPRWRRAPRMVPIPSPGHGTPTPPPQPLPPKPTPLPGPVDDDLPQRPPVDDDDATTTPQPKPNPSQTAECCEELLKQIADLRGRIDEVAKGQDTLAEGLLQLPTKADLEAVKSSNGSALEALAAQVAELKKKPCTAEVTFNVKGEKFISPSYVDVSVLWALQQKTGVDHIVLVVDTTADYWPRMAGEFDLARKEFPAFELFDVSTKTKDVKDKVTIKSLPQIVIFSNNEGSDPIILRGTDAVSKKLQDIYRGGSVGF